MSLLSFEDNRLSLNINGTETNYLVAGSDTELTIFDHGKVVLVELAGSGLSGTDESGEGRIVTPMPGKIVDVMVKAGDQVKKGEALMVMEAMKMEMTIRAGCTGIIDELPVSSNDQVQDGALLVSIKSEDKG